MKKNIQNQQDKEKNKEKNQTNIGLYIHIPFCKYICTYCDFCKKRIQYYNTSKYIKYLILELEEYKEYFNEITTIYIGGGTPTALKQEELQELFNYLNSNIDFQKIEEYTIEANPDDINDEEYVKFLKKNKITRVSLGVQTLNDNILYKLQRKHTKQHVIKAINLLNKYIDNVNIDLMFNLPEQTLQDIDETISFIKENQSKITHISYYSLILEENTILKIEDFYNLNEEEETEVYYKIQKELEDLGYVQYEISNYAQKNYDSIHNLKYWEREPYIGVGLGASSFLNEIRHTNTKSYNEYIDGIEKQEKKHLEYEKIEDKEIIIEQIMLGLRTVGGIDKEIFTKNNIKIDKRYLDEKENKIFIKKNYLFFSNEIITDIFLELEK